MSSATVDPNGLVTAVETGDEVLAAIGNRDASQEARAKASITVEGVTPTPTPSGTCPYLSSVTGFAPGLVGKVGYTVLNSSGHTYAARSITGVFPIKSIGYAASVPLPMTGCYIILWDDGAGHSAFEVANTLAVTLSGGTV